MHKPAPAAASGSARAPAMTVGARRQDEHKAEVFFSLSATCSGALLECTSNRKSLKWDDLVLLSAKISRRFAALKCDDLRKCTPAVQKKTLVSVPGAQRQASRQDPEREAERTQHSLGVFSHEKKDN